MQDKQPLFTRLTKLFRSKNVIRTVLWNSHTLFIILWLTRISETSFNICFGEAENSTVLIIQRTRLTKASVHARLQVVWTKMLFHFSLFYRNSVSLQTL